MAIGFLLSQGILKSTDHIQDIQVDTNTLTVSHHAQTSPPSHSTPSPPPIHPSEIFRLTAFFQEKALLFKKTAIAESVALCSPTTIEVFSEDISSINAFYKTVGTAYLNTLIPAAFILITSDKLTQGFIELLNTLSIKTVISRTAPTAQAIQLAQTSNIQVYGFARGKRVNKYC